MRLPGPASSGLRKTAPRDCWRVCTCSVSRRFASRAMDSWAPAKRKEGTARAKTAQKAVVLGRNSLPFQISTEDSQKRPLSRGLRTPAQPTSQLACPKCGTYPREGERCPRTVSHSTRLRHNSLVQDIIRGCSRLYYSAVLTEGRPLSLERADNMDYFLSDVWATPERIVRRRKPLRGVI